MADGHFTDVELLRRELATLILEWAGKATKDDPDGPMSTALTRAVGEAARGAVAEQHQALTADAAERIAEALDRRDQARGLIVWRLRPWVLGLIAVIAVALLAAAFLLGLQTGRTEAVAPSPATATTSAPIAPLAPAVDEPAPTESRQPAKPQPQAPPAAKPQRNAPAPTARATPPRELGRPAQANEAAPSSAQPVGATPTPPATTTPVPKP